MDESKRYNEPKKLGDILKNMQISSKIFEKNKKNALDIYKIIHINAKLIKQLDIIYQKANILINKIDAYYISERKSLFQDGKLITEKKLTSKDIIMRMQIIKDNLDFFETEFTNINISLKKIIKNFPCIKDQEEQNKKADDLYDFFINIYIDIENILIGYSELFDKISQK